MTLRNIIARFGMKSFLLVVVVIAPLLCQMTLGFVPTSPPFRIISSSSPSHTATALKVVVDPPEKEDVHKNNRRNRSNDDNDSTKTNKSWIPTRGGFLPNLTRRNRRLVTEVKSLEDYKTVVADEREQLVAVRFYAPWCKACRAVQSRFRKLATDHPGVKFVEVPLSEENAFLHEGLGIPSLPFAHIYHPEAGLVDERSINKKIFAEFKHELQTYVDGECEVDWDNSNADAASGNKK